jgi:hypothetical protein
VLQWAREYGCEWTEGTCYAAALGGHLEVLMWAHEHGKAVQVDSIKTRVVSACGFSD